MCLFVHKYGFLILNCYVCRVCALETIKVAGECTLWRVSFSHAEKTIMRAADYTSGVGGQATILFSWCLLCPVSSDSNCGLDC
jgi:hypothetical protein